MKIMKEKIRVKCNGVVVNAPYLAWRSQLVQQRQPGVQLHQDGQGH